MRTLMSMGSIAGQMLAMIGVIKWYDSGDVIFLVATVFCLCCADIGRYLADRMPPP